MPRYNISINVTAADDEVLNNLTTAIERLAETHKIEVDWIETEWEGEDDDDL